MRNPTPAARPANKVLYHHDCWDGFAAAYAAHRAMGGLVELEPVRHGEPLPEINEGTDVWILDFSYPRETLVALAELASKLILIDHHAQAEELADLPFVTYDPEHSAAVLSWEHFLPDEPLPDLYRYIEDRDLGIDRLEHSDRVAAALRSYPHQTGEFSKLLERDVAELAEEGRHVARYRDRLVQTMASRVQWVPLGPPGYVKLIPAVNTPIMATEVCRHLLQLHSASPVAACYYDRDKSTRVWELRGRTSDAALRIARHHGGGGHPKAAGFQSATDWLGQRADTEGSKLRHLQRKRDQAEEIMEMQRQEAVKLRDELDESRRELAGYVEAREIERQGAEEAFAAALRRALMLLAEERVLGNLRGPARARVAARRAGEILARARAAVRFLRTGHLPEREETEEG